MSENTTALSSLVGALPAGTLLHEYRIEGVLGHGGFGITYLARDLHLDKKVAIKEYLPNDLAARAADQTVTVRSPDTTEAFQWGLQSFIKEARVLGKFSHPGLIQVHRYFEANDTAYFVMEYAEGVTLSTVLKHEGNLSEARLRAILLPILNGLEEVHRLGVLHRDIKPDNIILREGGRPVLIDFGAARQNLSSMTRSVMSVLTAGYAPIEQYASGGNQGPWTDLYAIGAVAYRALSGKKPIDAINRIRDDPMVAATTLGEGRYADAFLAALDWALAVNPEDRPASVAEFREALDGLRTPPVRVPGRAGTDEVPPEARRAMPESAGGSENTVLSYLTPKQPARAPWPQWAMLAGIALLTLLGIGVYFSRQQAPTPAEPVATTPPDVASAPAREPPAKTSRQRAPAQGATRPSREPPAQQPAVVEPLAPAPSPAVRADSQDPPTPAGPKAAEPATSAPMTAAPTTAEPASRGEPVKPAEDAKPEAAPAQAKPEASPAQPAAPVKSGVVPVAQMVPLARFQDCPQCPTMVPLEAGSFQMGAQPADNGNAWEGPLRTVKLARPFAIGRDEVTVAQWQACVAAKACAAAAPGPASGDRAKTPVVNVNWNDAQAYVAWLTSTTGRRYRLPTEAEWEYAIRARTGSARYWGGDRRLQCRYGNGADQAAVKRDSKLSGVECNDGYAALAPVGTFEPNAFGLHDMAGNAWEWTQDCWRDSYQGAPADGRAVEVAGCTQRVIRGGSWRARPNSLRSFGRGNSAAAIRGEDLGLRVVAE